MSLESSSNFVLPPTFFAEVFLVDTALGVGLIRRHLPTLLVVVVNALEFTTIRRSSPFVCGSSVCPDRYESLNSAQPNPVTSPVHLSSRRLSWLQSPPPDCGGGDAVPKRNVEKVTAHGGIPKVSTYSVSKAALNALTKMHAHELKSARIRYAPRQWPTRVSHTKTHPHVPCSANKLSKCTVVPNARGDILTIDTCHHVPRFLNAPHLSPDRPSTFAHRPCVRIVWACMNCVRQRVNAINVGWTLTDNEHAIQRLEMESDDWIEEADKVLHDSRANAPPPPSRSSPSSKNLSTAEVHIEMDRQQMCSRCMSALVLCNNADFHHEKKYQTKKKSTVADKPLRRRPKRALLCHTGHKPTLL